MAYRVTMGFSPLGRDKRLMLTLANPAGMGHIVLMGFSPYRSNLSPQRQENNCAEIASYFAMYPLFWLFGEWEKLLVVGCWLLGNLWKSV